jgi:hypothetical protein
MMIKTDLGYRLAARPKKASPPAWAVLNPDGNEIAQCYLKEDAKLIVKALNSQQLATLGRAFFEKCLGKLPPMTARRGRPRIGEVREQPWVALGMSRRTWYRRRAEERHGRP